MIQHQVAIAGAGPSGMILAAELKLAGIDVGIVERRQGTEIEGSRAGGLHARSLEVLDQRGVVERFLAEGQTAQVYGFGSIHFDISDFPTRHPYGLALWQRHIERLMAGWIDELGIPVHRGREVTGFAQDEEGVALQLADGETVRALYLVGCDGGRSIVRRAAGIEFAGWAPSISHIIAEVEIGEGPVAWGMRQDATGMHGLSRVEYDIVDGKVVYRETGPVRVMLTERDLTQSGDPTFDDLKRGLAAVYGTDFGVHDPIWISRFTDMARQAVSYRKGRVLLAGDAAHVHYPAGGKGLNTGLQDAVNLGWKLAQVVRGISPASLLDSYEAERHPVAAQVLHDTLAHVAMVRTDDRSKALSRLVGEMLSLDETRRVMGGRMSELDIRYDFGPGHPLLGRRMPDLDLVTADGPVRAYTLLHAARPVLLDLGVPGGLDIDAWADRVQLVAARYAGAWELPVIGVVPAPEAVLIRPDGHVCWVGEGDGGGLKEALARWFGGPSARS
jgi:2-polyprenyl-6-methoxyphenol hydroxylase-like FAD-dependent oxidoreductase